MEGIGFTWFDGLGNVVRRKRSQTSSRPRPISQFFFRGHGLSPLLSTPSSEDASKACSDENPGYVTNLKKKDFSINHCERNSEGLSLGQFSVSRDGSGKEKRVKKVKLKFGGMTRTIEPNSASNGSTGSGSTANSSRSTEASRSREKQQSNSENNHSPFDKGSGLQGLPWKDFSEGDFGLQKEETLMRRISRKNMSKEGDKSEPVRKSKRVPRRRVLDGEFSDDDFEDDKIWYLEKLKTSKVSAAYRDEEEFGKKHRKVCSVSNMENAASSFGSKKDGKKKSRSDRVHEDIDYEDEEEPGSDVELEDKKKQNQRKESVDVLMDSKREMTLTRRQRALQLSKDASASGASLIEFPYGLPPAPPRKQKEKLSEVEQQLKKAEAAQKRRMQVEKAVVFDFMQKGKSI